MAGRGGSYRLEPTVLTIKHAGGTPWTSSAGGTARLLRWGCGHRTGPFSIVALRRERAGVVGGGVCQSNEGEEVQQHSYPDLSTRVLQRQISSHKVTSLEVFGENCSHNLEVKGKPK